MKGSVRDEENVEKLEIGYPSLSLYPVSSQAG